VFRIISLGAGARFDHDELGCWVKTVTGRAGSVITGAIIVVMTACGKSVERAKFQQPHSNIAVAIQRTSHGTFAEYERTVIVELKGQIAAQLSMLPDTGGYSRTNLYQLGDEHLLLLRDADASYTIDLGTRVITKDEARRQTGTFLGSFDVDDRVQNGDVRKGA
jgi:pyruvoyl-dependent arginine decarboxylase (PvlArgDC)